MSVFQQGTLIGAVMIGVASSGLTAWLMSVGDTSETGKNLAVYNKPYVEQQPVSPPLEDPAVIEQFMQMRAQIDAINKRLAALSDQNAGQVKAPGAANRAQSDSPLTQQEEATKALQQQVAQVADHFQMEETDSAWADNVAVKIQDAFIAEGIPENSSLLNVDCRTSMCKLDVSLKDGDGLASVRQQLMEKVGEVLPYGAIQPGKADNEVTIYLGSQSGVFAP